MQVKPHSKTPSIEDIAAFVANFAAHHNLTRKVVNGAVEYRGANPLDPTGSQAGQFLLRDNGTAYDHKLKKSYGLAELQQFSGENIAPYKEAPGKVPRHARKSEKPKFDWKAAFISYDYRDEQGALLYQVCRQGDGAEKEIRQRRFVQAGASQQEHKWLYSMKDTFYVLYQLPYVVKAKFLLIVEGEKAADTLNSALLDAKLFGEFVATTTTGGAEKNIESVNEVVQAKTIYVFPDNDDVGRRHAELVAVAAASQNAEVRVVDLPDRAQKGGVDDWLGSERVIGELLELAQAAPPFVATTDCKKSEEKTAFSLDDIGNGERFAADHCAILRFCTARERWLTYAGGVWTLDGDKTDEHLATISARKFLAEAWAEKDVEKQSKLLKHALLLQGRDKRSTMISDASHNRSIVTSQEKFDLDLQLFNCKNGTIDLCSMQFREHRSTDMLTQQSPVVFDANAKCPIWEECLFAWQEDEGVRDYLQESVGATLTGIVYDEYFNFFHGEGRNGKSTFLKVLDRLLGSYCAKTGAETLMQARDPRAAEAPQPEVLKLQAARGVIAQEILERHTFDAGKIKDITGRESITARGIHAKRAVTFLPQFSLWMYGNGKPRVTDTSDGMWRRVRLIEFANQISDNSIKLMLADQLYAELPGILNWALEGLKRVQARGLVVPQAIKDATNEYRAEQNPLAAWLDECCELGADFKQSNDLLWQSWKAWCERNGEVARSSKFITQSLKRHKCVPFVSGKTRGIRGICLNESLPENPSQPSQVSQKDEKSDTCDTLDTSSGKDSFFEKPKKQRRGNHADSEHGYGMVQQNEGLFNG